MSGLVNKIKDAMSSDKHHDQPEGTSGHHNPRATNAADPRIDSDRDHRTAPSSGLAGTGASSGLTGTGAGDYSSTGQHGVDFRNTFGTDGPATRTDGSHKSNALNKADPRVDSDRDHSRNMGANPQGTSGTGNYNATDSTRTGGLGGAGATSGFGSSTTRSSGLPEGTAGPHSSRPGNAIDPRVDSDLDRSRNIGGRDSTRAGGLGGAGTTSEFGSMGAREGVGAGMGAREGVGAGTYSQTTTGGLGGATTGSSGFASSGFGSSGLSEGGRGGHTTGGHGTTQGGLGSTTGYGTQGSGPGPNTAGPHKSDMLNKVDPRVDSDLDGSKTMGQDKTFQQSDDFAGRDPTDATQVPPSVMQKHIGAPEVAHEHHDAEHSRRHSVSHQEKHRGL